MDKFFLSKTLRCRIGESEISKINRNKKETFNHISSDKLRTKLVLAQNEKQPIFNAIQKCLPSACLITVYHEHSNDVTNWTGSGFLIHPGIIITSNHVLPEERGKSIIKVSFDGVNKISANVYSRNEDLDIGVLSIVANNIPPVNISNDEPLQGEQVAVIGAPEGWDNVVTVGYVSAVHKTPEKLPGQEWADLIFVDCDIYEGSSGSMVINDRGEIIGMVMGIIGKHASDLNMGQNAVIPIHRIIESILI